MGAAHHRLDNLICLVDINNQQADGPSSKVLGFEPLADKWAAFGWHVQRVAGNDLAAVLAAFDAARDAAVSAVVVELPGKSALLDLTATRRFALAAAEQDTMVLLARGEAKPCPSAAHTRWQVAAAPSRALEAHAPGAPAFVLDLLRQRGGRDGCPDEADSLHAASARPGIRRTPLAQRANGLPTSS